MISYRRNRLSSLERDILATLAENARCSYDEIAARCDCDRSSALIAVRRLELKGKLAKVEVGRARLANLYEVRV
jgi:DNA-binding Lrp family transcriptional regulator